MSVTIVTHNGAFHADDVFAVAVLSLYLADQSIRVIRTRDEEVIKQADYVIDVGGEYDPERGRFDHHQEDGAGQRSNGVPYAAFGLCWKHFGPSLAGSSEVVNLIDERLVQPIDGGDNGLLLYETTVEGLAPYQIQDLLAAFQPTWKEEGVSFDELFEQALELVKRLLQREIEVAGHLVEGFNHVRSAYERAEDKRLIVLEQPYPWKDVLLEFAEPLYVVSPRPIGGRWGVKAVPQRRFAFELRKPLPAAWAGAREGQLKQITGIADAVFCHRNCFLAVAETKEAALQLARLALEA